MTRNHPGFTLIEVIVAVAVVLLLAAAVVPNLAGVLDRGRVDAAAESLQALTDAMTEMRADNQDWPGRLSHLAWPITTSDKNICGNTYANGKVGNWAGPYIDRTVPATGVPIGIGVARDSLVRQLVSGNDGYLIVEVTGVAEEDAIALNAKVDADNDAGGGTVRWTAPSSTLVTLQYLRPIRGC